MRDRRYAESHEWIMEEGGSYLLGISDFAQDQLGDVVYVSFPEVGSSFIKGAEMCVIESVKVASDIYAPVDLKVVGVNEKLTDNPELVNEQAEGGGWLLRVEVVDEGELESLLDESTYKSENN